MKPTRTEILNFIIDKYRFNSYLELGVYDPKENFDKINANFKHSVDNLPLPEGYGRYTHWMDTNYFFENFAKDKYDIIFIDVLHEEDQCYKDIKNSLKHLNEGGFIVVHDVSPEQKENTIHHLDFLEGKNYGEKWNGTCYIAFIRVKHELKDWSCFTIDEFPGGCGIITKRNILENKIIDFYNTWEFYVENKKELLQLITFEEFKNLI